MSILNGIFKGLWKTFSDLNDDLRSGVKWRVQDALVSYFFMFMGLFIFAGISFGIYLAVTQGSPYKCVEYRDDGLRTVYNSTTKTSTLKREKTCMVMIHKEFTGSVEVK